MQLYVAHRRQASPESQAPIDALLAQTAQLGLGSRTLASAREPERTKRAKFAEAVSAAAQHADGLLNGLRTAISARRRDTRAAPRKLQNL